MPDSGVPDHSLRRRVQQLERNQERLEKLLTRALQRPVVNHEVVFRLAKTVADPADTPDYPAYPATTFKFVFLDASFTRTVGNQTLTENSRVGADSPYQSIGRSFNGMYLPEGLVCGCLYQHPLDATKGYHYLIPIGGGFVGYLGYGDTITARTGTVPSDVTPGSGTVDLYYRNPSTGKLALVAENVTVYNDTLQTPAASSIFIQLKVDFYGTFWWDVDDCAA